MMWYGVRRRAAKHTHMGANGLIPSVYRRREKSLQIGFVVKIMTRNVEPGISSLAPFSLDP